MKENRIAEEEQFPLNGIRICIDHYGDDLEGRIYSRMNREPIPFENCSEMLLKADRLFDERGYPQTFQEKRNFSGKKERCGYSLPQVILKSEEIRNKHGDYCTIDAVIQSRRRAGWQGVLLEKDGAPTKQFQSEMELLECIRSRLEKDGGPFSGRSG